MVVYVVLGLAVLFGFWFAGTYNSLAKSKLKVEEAFSTIDVFLKKRYDLIPNLVATVKGYAAHEKETLTQVVDARAKAIGSGSIEEKIQNEGELTRALSRLMVLTENYPQLKADSQFLNLQQQLTGLEGEISQSRRYYNGTVKNYNTLIAPLPSMIVAQLAHFAPAQFFNIEGGQRDPVTVDFSK
jgi:LemA protein